MVKKKKGKKKSIREAIKMKSLAKRIDLDKPVKKPKKIFKKSKRVEVRIKGHKGKSILNQKSQFLK